jgi:hypothetical protein
MGRKDREQARDRGNADVVKDERGRGAEAGREAFASTRDQAEGTTEDVDRRDEESAEVRGREGRADRGAQPEQRYTVGLKNPSSTGGKVGRAADRRDDSGDPERP